jgi:hypothetical protein
MTSGTATISDAILTEAWAERSQKKMLLNKSLRLRERITETEAFVLNAGDAEVRRSVRRCIADAELLIELAERLLQTSWTDR